MSKRFVLVGDIGTDHEGFPATQVLSGSPNVFMDGKPMARVDDPLAMHDKPKHPPHPRTIASGEPMVIINGMEAAITGGTISCGGVTVGTGSGVVNGQGSSNVSGSGDDSTGAASAQNAAMTQATDGTSALLANEPIHSVPGARSLEAKTPNLPKGVRHPNEARSNRPDNIVNSDQNNNPAVADNSPEKPGREEKTLRLGVFFDGTGNNMLNDRRMSDRDITNVVKLYDLYRDEGAGGKSLHIYIPGVGTEAGMQTEDGYEASDNLFSLASGVGQEGGQDRIRTAIERVRVALQQGQYTDVTVDVFGFSRGAALARHFVNLVNRWPEFVYPTSMGPTLAFPPEVKAKVGFVGLFDTVGSFYWPGNANEGGFNLNLSAASADQVVHLTAFHEIRENFPLTSIAGSSGLTPGNFTEKALPGAHSDVGGGYENPSEDIRNYETFLIKTYQGHGMNGETVRAAQQKVAALDATDPRNIQMRVDGTDVVAEERRATRKELAINALHQMYNYALQAGVPLRAMDTSQEKHRIPDELRVALNQWKAAGGKLENSRRFLQEYIHTSHRERADEVVNAHRPEPLGQRRVFANEPVNAARPQEQLANVQ